MESNEKDAVMASFSFAFDGFVHDQNSRSSRAWRGAELLHLFRQRRQGVQELHGGGREFTLAGAEQVVIRVQGEILHIQRHQRAACEGVGNGETRQCRRAETRRNQVPRRFQTADGNQRRGRRTFAALPAYPFFNLGAGARAFLAHNHARL